LQMKPKSIFNLGLALMLLSGLLAWAGPAQLVRAEGTHYVTPDGNDSADCATPSTPCRTIQRAVEASIQGTYFPGGNVLAASGVYTGAADKWYVVNTYYPVYLSGGWDSSFTEQKGFSIIDGQNEKIGFNFYGNYDARIDHFIIRNGNAGDKAGAGGINVIGSLILSNSIVSHNVGPAGGITSSGILTIKNSSILFNSALLRRGGISVSGTSFVYVINSTIAGNTAPQGGGIFNLNGYGYPIYLNNVTITDNTAQTDGGGIYSTTDQLYGDGAVHMQNTILAGNEGGSTPDCSTGIISDGFNLIQATSGCTITGNTSGNITGIVPDLMPVDENQGYYPLRSTSPAVDAGNPSGCLDPQGNLLDSDQRGAPRLGRCDIGAYEYTPPGPVANLIIISGSGQAAGLLEAFSDPLQLRVLDAMGTPVGEESISFSAPEEGPGGTFEDNGLRTITVETDEGGFTSALFFRANGAVGSYTIEATSLSSGVAADFGLTNLVRVYLPLVLKPDPAAIVDEFPFTDRCGSSYITYNGANMAKMTLCVTGVRIRQDGQMYFDTHWLAEFLDSRVTSIYKNSDAENPNMYITDNLGNRYGHVAVGGAAAQTTYFYPSGPTSAEGWFLFPRAQAGATVFTFHVDDETPPYTIGNLVLAH
jgi:predicted outer membrane repeat protein